MFGLEPREWVPLCILAGLFALLLVIKILQLLPRRGAAEADRSRLLPVGPFQWIPLVVLLVGGTFILLRSARRVEESRTKMREDRKSGAILDEWSITRGIQGTADVGALCAALRRKNERLRAAAVGRVRQVLYPVLRSPRSRDYSLDATWCDALARRFAAWHKANGHRVTLSKLSPTQYVWNDDVLPGERAAHAFTPPLLAPGQQRIAGIDAILEQEEVMQCARIERICEALRSEHPDVALHAGIRVGALLLPVLKRPVVVDMSSGTDWPTRVADVLEPWLAAHRQKIHVDEESQTYRWSEDVRPNDRDGHALQLPPVDPKKGLPFTLSRHSPENNKNKK